MRPIGALVVLFVAFSDDNATIGFPQGSARFTLGFNVCRFQRRNVVAFGERYSELRNAETSELRRHDRDRGRAGRIPDGRSHRS